ncbi:MAG: transporter periplasmic component [Alphaproteobacteria bacterium]|nr:transporter periplasmic component [Alphaproteobacteria bacterium]
MKFARPLLLALAFALASNSADAADKMTVLLDWFINPDHAALVIARDKGYFAKHNLEVTLIAPADPSAPPKLVAAGQAELAVSYQPQLHLFASEGLPLVRVGALVAQPLNTLIVLEDGPVKTLADLKGRKVGFSVGGFEDALLATMLEGAGLTLKDVTLVNVNFNLSTALMSGQVDAVVGGFRNFELNQLAIEKRRGKAFLPEQHGVPAYDELILVAHRDKVDVAKTRRVLAALAEATAWIKANPDEAWSVFVKSGKELDNELNRRAWRDTVPLLAADPVELDTARYVGFSAFLRQKGMLKQPVPVDRYTREIR